jgi:hypothetical protein
LDDVAGNRVISSWMQNAIIETWRATSARAYLVHPGAREVLEHDQAGIAFGHVGFTREVADEVDAVPRTRGLHSYTIRLNVSTFCWIRWVHGFPPVY